MLADYVNKLSLADKESFLSELFKQDESAARQWHAIFYRSLAKHGQRESLTMSRRSLSDLSEIGSLGSDDDEEKIETDPKEDDDVSIGSELDDL